MLVLVVAQLVQLMKRLDIAHQTCEFSSRRPVHAVVQLNGHAVKSAKQLFEVKCLPHKRTSWVLAQPEDVVLLEQDYQLAGYAM